MRSDETLDEAIDRVATRMTLSDRVDVVPVWMQPPRPMWFGWRLVGGLSAIVVLLGVAMMSLSRTGEQRGDKAIDARPLVVWSSFQAPALARSDAGTPDRLRHSDGDSRRPSERRLAALDREARPSWGIPFIEGPGALRVAEFTTPDISIEHVGVEALDVAPLSLGDLNRDAGITSAKEQ